MAKIVNVYTNEDGETITKIEGITGTVLVESFLNSNSDLEYSSYIHDDGGIVNIETNELSKESIVVKYKETLNDLLCESFDINIKGKQENV